MDKEEYGQKYRLDVRAVIYHDAKILVVRHIDKNTGEGVAYWSTPGGGIERKEALADGIRREMMEEFAVEAKVGRLLFCMQWFNKKKEIEMVEFFYLIENPEDFIDMDLEQTPNGAKEIAEIKYVDPKEVEIMPRFLNEVDLKDICENVREVMTISFPDES